MIKIFTCFLSTMFTTSLLFMAMASSAIAQEKIKLGAVLPLTEITGKDASRSMQLAVKQINAAGGLLGKQVELIIVDDEMKPDKAVAAVEKLVNTDKVDIIVGGTNNAITMEVIPVLKKYQKVTVWTGASSAKVEQALEGQDWFFHLHAWDYQLGAYYEKIWREIVQKHPLVKKKMIFVAYKEDPFGSDIYTVNSPVAKAYLNLLGGEAYKSTADFRALLKNARIFGPNIFILDGSEKDAIPMLEEAKNYGFAPPIYLVNSVILPVDFGKQVGADGVMFYSYWHDSMKSRNKASSEYSAAFNNEFKEAPATYFGPLAYTNIMIVANAIKKAGSLDKVALISAMEATNYESPLGDTFAFARSLSIKQQAGAYPKLMQWQGGNAKIIWPWELATGKLIYPFPAQGFNKAPPLEEVKPPAPPTKPAAKGSKPDAPAKMKQPAPAVKPTTSAPAAKPAVPGPAVAPPATPTPTVAPAAKSTVTTPTAAPAAKPSDTTTTSAVPAPAAVTPAPAASAAKSAAATTVPAATPEAKPAVTVDMTGLWKLAVVTPQGAGNPEFTLKQEGNKLTGNYAGSFGEASATGTVQGRNFEIRYRLGGVTTVYKGKVDGNNKMSGDVDFGGQASGTFTGEKK